MPKGSQKTTKPKKPVGRPPENIIEPINDTPENVARAVMASKK